MFKLSCKPALALAFVYIVSFNAQAVNYLDGYYIGAGVHNAKALGQYDFDGYADDIDGDGTGLHLFTGYWAADNIALELEGRYWGVEFDNSDTNGNLGGSLSAGFKFHIPIADQFDLTANFGLSHWFIDDFDEAGEGLANHDASAYYGLGGAFYLDENLEIGVRIQNHGVFATETFSYGLYTAYHFGDMRRSPTQDIFSRLYVAFNAAQFSRGGYSESVDFGANRGTVGDDLENYLAQIPSYDGDGSFSSGDDSDGYYFFIGYQVNDWVSLEIGGIEYGEYDFNVGSVRDDNDVEFVINEQLLDAQMSGVLFGLKAMAYRSKYGINLYTRFGVSRTTTEIDRFFLSEGVAESVTTAFTSPYYGAGISYQVMDSLSVSLDYIVFELDDVAVNSRSRSIGLGVSFAFGSESRSATNVRKSSVFTEYFSDEGDPATNSLERTTACQEKYRDMFYGCGDETGDSATDE